MQPAADENIEVVKQIPLERLQIETDGPWVNILAKFRTFNN